MWDAVVGWLTQPLSARTVAIVVLAFVLSIMIMTIGKRR